jgi:hypothetical protein
MSDPLVVLRGRVECRREACGALGLTLLGRGDAPGLIRVSFAGPAPSGLPETLDGALVHRLSDAECSISSAGERWVLRAVSVHVHRDVGDAFYAAVPPRRARLSKRLIWGLVLAVAGRPLGRRMLARLRRARQ